MVARGLELCDAPQPPRVATAPGRLTPAPGVNGADGKVIAWTAGGNDRKMKGNDYLQQFALPNFFFFVTIATTSCVIAASRSESGIFSARSTGSKAVDTENLTWRAERVGARPMSAYRLSADYKPYSDRWR